jgi:hypothetical protein
MKSATDEEEQKRSLASFPIASFNPIAELYRDPTISPFSMQPALPAERAITETLKDCDDGPDGADDDSDSEDNLGEFDAISEAEADNRRPKFSATGMPGRFLGYVLESGGKWKGDYVTANLNDLRRGKIKPRIDQTKKIYLDPGERFTFPMLPLYNHLTRTVPVPETQRQLHTTTLDQAHQALLVGRENHCSLMRLLT